MAKLSADGFHPSIWFRQVRMFLKPGAVSQHLSQRGAVGPYIVPNPSEGLVKWSPRHSDFLYTNWSVLTSKLFPGFQTYVTRNVLIGSTANINTGEPR